MAVSEEEPFTNVGYMLHVKSEVVLEIQYMYRQPFFFKLTACSGSIEIQCCCCCFFFLAPYSSHNSGPDPWDVGVVLPGKLNPGQKIVPSEMLFGQSLLDLIGQKKIV